MGFCRTSKVKRIPISKKFIENISSTLKNTRCIHHSHITGERFGYSHMFCNEKVRENYYKIPVVAHNLFRFDFFFTVKELRAGVWKTRDIVIGGKNPANINFAYIGGQVRFVETIKYFQQKLPALASSLTSSKKFEIAKACENYLTKDPKCSKKFLFLSKIYKKWVLEHLSSGKGMIPYELIIDFDSPNISPSKYFFEIHQFHSDMKDSVLSTE